jgi:ribonuclease Z
MTLLLRFLGTAASRPTVERGVSALALQREGETLLVDCGEGTQRQMMRYGVSFALEDIFFTHTHADHILGLTGLLRTLALQGRVEPLRLWAPSGSARLLQACIALGGERTPFRVTLTEVAPGEAVRRDEYRMECFPVEHGGTGAVGWALIEEERRGRFNPELARALGIPEGPLWGKLHRGLAVTLDDGRVIDGAQLVGETRRGRRVVITGDTRPCDATVAMAADADLLVHEATFSEDEAPRARETGHSTAREAAQVAARAGARRLLLTHISARYSFNAQELEAEARAVFPRTRVARDGLEVELRHTEEPAAGAAADDAALPHAPSPAP